MAAMGSFLQACHLNIDFGQFIVSLVTVTGKNNIQEQQYRVLVSLDKQSITAYAQNEKLKPGMALDADFIVDKRRLYEWVLEPIFALGHKISL
jgi:membrane fusion protein